MKNHFKARATQPKRLFSGLVSTFLNKDDEFINTSEIDEDIRALYNGSSHHRTQRAKRYPSKIKLSN